MPASGSSTPSTPSPDKISVTPTRLSPGDKDEDSPNKDEVTLPRGCKLELNFESGRLLLKKRKKHELQWPMGELTRIEVTHSASAGEPCLKFMLGSNVEHQQKAPPADAELLDAYHRGALRRGTKVLFMTAADAKQLYAALRAHKDAGAACLADAHVCDSELLDAAATLGRLSLGGDAPPSGAPPSGADVSRQASDATSVASCATSGGGAPREALIFVCSPTQQSLHLPHAKDEAIDVANEVTARIRRGGSPTDLKQELLDGHGAYKYFLFSGHGDVRLPPVRSAAAAAAAAPAAASEAAKDASEAREASRTVTLGFTNTATGQLELTLPTTLAAMLASHGLQLVFLNGCDTASLGAQLRQRGVPHVVCWRTKAADAASRTLARAFFAALAKGRSVGEAYGDATQSVLAMATRRGVPLFMFCDPDADGEDAKTSPP